MGEFAKQNLEVWTGEYFMIDAWNLPRVGEADIVERFRVERVYEAICIYSILSTQFLR